MSRQLTNEPWNENLRKKVWYEQKQYKKLTRKKHRLFKSKLVGSLLDIGDKNPSSFWKTIDMLKDKCNDEPSTNLTPNQWTDYVNKLLNTEQRNNYDETDNAVECKYVNISTESLNKKITTEEVLKVAKSIKCKTSCGIDEITNNMLKVSCLSYAEIYVKLFNLILETGIYPSIWTENLIKPLFKGGNFTDPSNYRGIALSSCFAKFFSKILCNRLDTYLEDNDIICKEQIGFRKGCRTSDHVLTLKTLVDKAFKKSSKLFCCFVDMKKAFDLVNRNALFHKLNKYNVDGNFFRILKNMYNNVSYSVKLKGGLTSKLNSKVGVKQGCILSPTLFSVYLNDLVNIFDATCDPVELDDIKLSCLLYADDIVLLSKTSSGLQSCLDKLNMYCNKWNLTVNHEKTNIMIFNKAGRTIKNVKFMYDGMELCITDEYKYLGIIFKPSGVFTQSTKHLCNKALKALFCIRKQLLSDYNNVLPHLRLFEACIKPILLYCSEVCTVDSMVHSNYEIEGRFHLYEPEKVQIKFCKMLLGVNKAAVNMAVLSELVLSPFTFRVLTIQLAFGTIF